MRVLVTGGAGFIGSHLCESLLLDGYQVVCLDNLSTGRLMNLETIRHHPRFCFVHHDIRTPFDIQADSIFNLACPASPIHYQRDPVATLQTCLLGTIHALELAKKYSIRILQASTSEIYGDPSVHPQPESYRGNVSCIGPRSCYDEGKRAAESLCDSYRSHLGINTAIVRIFNAYGPHMAENDGRVVSNFMVQALRHQPFTLYGDGSHTRSFCFVADVVRGLRALMDSQVSGPINIGNPHEITIHNLAARIASLVGVPFLTESLPLPIHDPYRRCPDISLASSALAWHPRVDLEEGLQQTIRYFRTL